MDIATSNVLIPRHILKNDSKSVQINTISGSVWKLKCSYNECNALAKKGGQEVFYSLNGEKISFKKVECSETYAGLLTVKLSYTSHMIIVTFTLSS